MEKAYLVTNKEPRRNVILFNSKEDRSTISYARYLMSVHLRRFLEKDELVDHINGDKLDDRIENYQILSSKQNNVKGVIQGRRGELYARFKCGVCGSIFEKPKRQTHLTIKKRNSTYCNRVCGAYSKNFGESELLEIFRMIPKIDESVIIT